VAQILERHLESARGWVDGVDLQDGVSGESREYGVNLGHEDIAVILW